MKNKVTRLTRMQELLVENHLEMLLLHPVGEVLLLDQVGDLKDNHLLAWELFGKLVLSEIIKRF